MYKAFGLTLLLSFGIHWLVPAQETVDKPYTLTSLTTQYGWTVLDLTDTYLTDLPYSGYGLEFGSTARRFLNTGNQRVSTRTDINVLAGVAMNQPQTASMTYIGGNIGYGIQYHFMPLPRWQLLLGGEWDAELGGKAYGRDVNNAGNMDFATNLNLAATLRYELPIRKNSLKFQIDARVPFFGLMFVPEMGESYSEIVYLGSSENLIHYSTFGNKNGLSMRYSVQCPLRNTTFLLGLQTDYLTYSANQLFFKRNCTSIQVGAVYDLLLFGGRKNKLPAGFRSMEW
jgi:hypothetical protein